MTTSLHNLHGAHGARHRPKRVGRGNASGHGTTATRGTKGQRARSGGRRGLKRLGMKRILLAMPKHRGFLSHRIRPATLPVTALQGVFGSGAMVTVESLKAKGLVPRDARAVKLLGGTMKTPLTVKGVAVSSGARAAIEAAGGQIVG